MSLVTRAGQCAGPLVSTTSESMWYVYVVRCADGTLYTGVAKDLPQRITAHNAGRGAKYTRGRLPVMLVYRETAADRAAAQKREHEIKRLPRLAKRALFTRPRRAPRSR